MKEAVFEVYRLYGGRGIEQVGEITNVLSYHINLNYNECDTFSFKVINDRDNSRLLQIGYMIRCLSAHYYEQLDAEKLGLEDFYFDGIIESVIYSQDEQGIEYIEVTGRDVSCLLERRIVYRYGVGEWFYDGNI